MSFEQLCVDGAKDLGYPVAFQVTSIHKVALTVVDCLCGEVQPTPYAHKHYDHMGHEMCVLQLMTMPTEPYANGTMNKSSTNSVQCHLITLRCSLSVSCNVTSVSGATQLASKHLFPAPPHCHDPWQHKNGPCQCTTATVTMCMLCCPCLQGEVCSTQNRSTKCMIKLASNDSFS